MHSRSHCYPESSRVHGTRMKRGEHLSQCDTGSPQPSQRQTHVFSSGLQLNITGRCLLTSAREADQTIISPWTLNLGTVRVMRSRGVSRRPQQKVLTISSRYGGHRNGQCDHSSATSSRFHVACRQTTFVHLLTDEGQRSARPSALWLLL